MSSQYQTDTVMALSDKLTKFLKDRWSMAVMKIIITALLAVSQARDAVIIIPPISVAAVNDSKSTRFTCLSPTGQNEGGIVSLQWLLNGVFLEDLSLNNVNSSLAGASGTLIFSRVRLDQNSTSVSCSVNFTSGRVENSSNSLLLVQGLLSSVDALNITASDSTLSLTWEPPFTLDITGVDPDITYCVDVINFTSSKTLYSLCDINMTEFFYPLPQDAVCHSYILTVSPINVVGRGAPSSMPYIGTEAGLSDVLDVERMSESDVMNGKQVFSFIISMSAPVCVAEVISLVNLDTGTRESVADSELTITEDFAIMFTIPLPVNHHYNTTIRARNVAGTAEVSIQLSTHDIKMAEILPSTVSITYFTGSNARGALLSQVCFTDTNTSISNSTSTFQTLHRSQRPIPYNLMACHSGQIQIFLYDIERSGTLSTDANYLAAAVKQRLATGTDVLPESILFHLRNCSVETFPPFIRAKCAYPGDSGAMVTGFQVIAQPTNFDGLGKLYANYTSEGQTSVVLEVEQNGEFLVSVIPVLGETGIVNSSVEYTEVVVVDNFLTTTSVSSSNEDIDYVIPAASLGVVVVVIITILLVVFLCMCARQKICCWRKRNTSSRHDENDYAPAPQPRNNITLWTEPNGEQETRMTMPDSEHLQQQQEHIYTMQLPEKESDEISERSITDASPNAVVVDVGDHYAALNLSTQAEGENMMIRDGDLVYATAVGFKNKNSNYVFVDTTSRTASEAVNLHEVSRDFLDGVVYSAIVPQESVKGKKKKKKPPPLPPPTEENESTITNLTTTKHVHERVNEEVSPTLIEKDLMESRISH